MAAGDLAEFRARDVDRPSIPKDAFFVAVDPETGRAVGYGSVLMVPGSTTTAWHDMTAVLRAYRGRGIARVLKEATIAWADRQRPHGARDRQRRGERPDARGECAPRVPAIAR